MQTIEIDCPPGEPRPDAIMRGIVEEAGLEYKEPVGKLFGNWTWDYKDMPKEEWVKLSAIAKVHITSAYNSGLVRYGSW